MMLEKKRGEHMILDKQKSGPFSLYSYSAANQASEITFFLDHIILQDKIIFLLFLS